MTDAVMSLRALAEKSADVDVLHGMIGFAAHRLMELEVAGLQVKAPSESKGRFDYYKLLETIPGAEAFRPLSAGNCPLVKRG